MAQPGIPEELHLRVLAAVQTSARLGELPPGAEHAGLPAAEFEGLCERLGLPAQRQLPASEPPALLSPLIELLWAHRADDAAWTRLMAGVVASAAFGGRHLWQDLGAAGRAEVTALMQHHFPRMAARNVLDLKWKNHLFRCLGAELGYPDLRPPRCDGCDEIAMCFPDSIHPPRREHTVIAAERPAP